jgi:hypothetical protein
MSYQANARSNGLRRNVREDVDGGVEPVCPSIVATPGLIQALDLLLKDSKNGSGRITGLKLSGERMASKSCLVRFSYSFKALLIIT